MPWLKAVVALACLALAGVTADARPRQARTDSQTLVLCAADGTYRQTCGQPETRLQRHARVGTSGSTLPCARTLDCGCSLARVLGISDKALARRLWVARDWLREFPRTGASVGAVAVLSRGRGGHVGIVKGVDPNGNPIVESFKYYGSVGEAVYPKSRVLGYVRPS